MGQLLTGIGIILFGLIICGVGLATAGVGIGIPMIPLGGYIVIRGGRKLYLDKRISHSPAFERTRSGRFLFGILLVMIGVATSALVIGIPVAVVGVGLVVSSLWSK
jgi:hypothetical protein